MKGEEASTVRREEASPHGSTLRRWERVVFGVGVFVAAGLVLIPGFSYGAQELLEKDCEAVESANPFAVIAQAMECMDEELTHAAWGGFVGLLATVVVGGLVVRRWRRRPPGRALAWTVTAVGPVAIALVAMQGGETSSEVVDPCYSTGFFDTVAPRREPVSRDDRPRVAYVGRGAVCVVNELGIAEPLLGVPPAGVVSPDGGRVAFIDGEELVVSQLDGSGEVSIFESDRFSSLAWSPDGTRLAFERGGDHDGIWVIGSDGTGLTRLTDVFRDHHPTWSPDGTRIAFARCVRTRTGSGCTGVDELWVMDADGSDQTQITSGGSFRIETPEWSPKGNLIAFERHLWHIWLVDADTGIQAPLVDNAHSPTWSPDGSQLAYVFEDINGTGDQEGIWSINTDGTNPKPIIFHPNLGAIQWLALYPEVPQTGSA